MKKKNDDKSEEEKLFGFYVGRELASKLNNLKQNIKFKIKNLNNR